MKRSELALILQIAARIDPGILVIGSQSILGSYDEAELPDEAVASIEVDVAFIDDPHAEKADVLDGAIGELSPFHQRYGIYGQGVEVRTATLPDGWERRVVSFGRAWCLEPHDLVISKLIAGRPKDFEFAGALIDAGLVSVATLLERAHAVDLPHTASQRLINNVGAYDRGMAPEL
jgi:hypothetical protein